jgi:hypothetical protein
MPKEQIQQLKNPLKNHSISNKNHKNSSPVMAAAS